MPRLIVSNMHPSATEGDIIKLFQTYGDVKRVHFVWHKFGPKKGKCSHKLYFSKIISTLPTYIGEPKGYCFVDMESNEICDFSIRFLHNKTFKSRPLVVRYSNQESDDVLPCSSVTSLKRRKSEVDDNSSSGTIKLPATIFESDIPFKKPTDAKKTVRVIDDKIARIQDIIRLSLVKRK